MHVQVNTDQSIEGHQSLDARVSVSVENALRRFIEHITRVEVHLSDQNGKKGGQDDMRCVMEARLEGQQPMAVTHRAATLDQAVDGAAGKLTRKLDSALGRLRGKRNDPTDQSPTEAATSHGWNPSQQR